MMVCDVGLPGFTLQQYPPAALTGKGQMQGESPLQESSLMSGKNALGVLSPQLPKEKNGCIHISG